MSQRGALASALTSVAGWLVEPEAQPRAAPARGDEVLRPVVAVAGVRRGCGVTTIARALGVVLASADSTGACVVTSASGAGALPLGSPAGNRMARRVAAETGGRPRACGRLCLVDDAGSDAVVAAARWVAPVVLDVSEPAEAAAAVSMADAAVLVAGPDSAPSLAAVIGQSLGVVGPAPVVAVNRTADAGQRWAGEPHVAVPESRLAAQLAAAGREPRGPFGDAVAELGVRLGLP